MGSGRRRVSVSARGPAVGCEARRVGVGGGGVCEARGGALGVLLRGCGGRRGDPWGRGGKRGAVGGRAAGRTPVGRRVGQLTAVRWARGGLGGWGEV